ncbi:MAG TPA: BrnA antitoxin family protein [Candidatus Solibacter sp.]|nr:BrnA antitoxin family protein [Candidatus Solibacter sp.]
MRRLSKEQKEDIARLAAMSDDDIDFSDIPLKLDWSRAEIGKFYRPPKKSVTMRLDEDILDWLKGYGPGYQTRVNLLLRHAMTNSAEPRKDRKKSRRVS